MSDEARMFLRKFVRRPKQIGSAVPSSRFLAESMSAPIPWHSVRAIAELGAGTGAVTREITRRALPGTKIYLFEKDSKMRKQLMLNHPGCKVAANAANMAAILEQHGEPGLDCIVSCLPFYNFPQTVRDAIMDQVRMSLKPGGLFIAFQYSLQMKKRLSCMFKIERIKFVPLNFPPAFVYVCRKEAERGKGLHCSNLSWNNRRSRFRMGRRRKPDRERDRQ
ncbi:methyltransferase domain-containing protein [Cohnella terricola]|uniref:Methyltransferase domain-containing protein n=2 Tax=Cohnella terricola TaxID=1289167 RepID=A0A559JG07_9BACL|nr:methyltransferase domain-containing protein [Cohnella terricola]